MKCSLHRCWWQLGSQSSWPMCRSQACNRGPSFSGNLPGTVGSEGQPYQVQSQPSPRTCIPRDPWAPHLSFPRLGAGPASYPGLLYHPPASPSSTPPLQHSTSAHLSHLCCPSHPASILSWLEFCSGLLPDLPICNPNCSST